MFGKLYNVLCVLFRKFSFTSSDSFLSVFLLIDDPKHTLMTKQCAKIIKMKKLFLIFFKTVFIFLKTSEASFAPGFSRRVDCEFIITGLPNFPRATAIKVRVLENKNSMV